MIGFFFYKIAYFIAMRLSWRAGYRVAAFLSLLKYHLSPRDRRAVFGNLTRILPPSQQEKINRYAKEAFVHFGKYLFEFFRFSLLTKENLTGFIKIEGLHHIERALGKGKGVIILTAHIGNWELGGVAMSLLGYPFVAVALPHRHRKVDAFFNLQRQRLGAEVIPSLGPAVRRIYDALKHNKMIALVGDRDFANSGKRMEFLGASKIIPRGPAVLALKTGAAIVPAFVIRQKNETCVLEFLEPIDCSCDEDAILAACTRVIEEKIRQYPAQWLMFREFWKE